VVATAAGDSRALPCVRRLVHGGVGVVAWFRPAAPLTKGAHATNDGMVGGVTQYHEAADFGPGHHHPGHLLGGLFVERGADGLLPVRRRVRFHHLLHGGVRVCGGVEVRA